MLPCIKCSKCVVTASVLQVIEGYCNTLKGAGYPELRTLLCIGGIDMRAQTELIRRGIHMVVATPGRLKARPLHAPPMSANACVTFTWPIGATGDMEDGLPDMCAPVVSLARHRHPLANCRTYYTRSA